MDYKFAERISSLAPSAIREILKYSSEPGFISLAAGSPASDAFPIEDISAISAKILAERPMEALHYSVSEGYTPLRNHVRDYMRTTQGVGNDNDNILITSGAQQVMDLATKAICNEGDAIICESPSFVGSVNAFRSYGLNLVGVPMESDGMNMEILEQKLKSTPNVKLIYVIPNFQNPTGFCMSYEKRVRLYELAKQYSVMIIEDNPYGDIRFTGEPIPSIKSMDDEGLVIYAGSFSKVLAPAMRVGFCIAPAPVIQKMVVCKQVSDVHTQMWSQLVTYEFMTKCDYAAHLDKIRAIYREKAQKAQAFIAKYIGDTVKCNPIEGGLFLWLQLPDHIPSQQVCTAALKYKVAVVPGSAFSIEGDDNINCIRINYSAPSDENLEKGIQLLAKTLEEFK